MNVYVVAVLCILSSGFRIIVSDNWLDILMALVGVVSMIIVIYSVFLKIKDLIEVRIENAKTKVFADDIRKEPVKKSL